MIIRHLFSMLFLPIILFGQTDFDSQIDAVMPKVIKWRRHFHQFPELSNREFKTAEVITKHLIDLGFEVKTKIAHTGVVGILKGNQPGKVLALRADMDALPVTERTDVPFKSTLTTTYDGVKTGVMHACGHDAHVAILMGVAEIFANNRDFPGTIKFIFQPAEEGTPKGEEGGARLMVKEGVLKNPDVDAIFGLHIWSTIDAGQIRYRFGGIMAASQRFDILVKGKQSHGSRPWAGVDPIVASSKIIDGLQTLVSREMELTKEAVVLTVGKISSGVRANIIPEEATIIGTLRTLDYDMQAQINKRMKEMVPTIAKAYRAEASIDISKGYPITFNEKTLMKQMLPSLEKAAGKKNVKPMYAITGAEDFSFYQKEIPGVFFFIGGKPLSVDADKAAPHHTPDFYIDESGFKTGVKAFVQMTLDYLNN